MTPKSPELDPDHVRLEIPIDDNAIVNDESKNQEQVEEPAHSEEQPPPVENSNFYTANFVKCFILLLVTGSASTLLAKYETLIPNDVGSQDNTTSDKHFNHPLIQTFFMFGAELCCLIAYLVYDFTRKIISGPGEKMKFKFAPRLIFTSFIDGIGSYFLFYGLSLTKASSYQMLRGSVIIFTGAYQKFFMKKKFSTSMYVGMILFILGLLLVEIPNLSIGQGNKAIQGDGIIIGCMVLNAINWASREKMLLQNEGISTMNVVGLEGLLGVVYTFALVALLAIFPKYNSIVDDVNLAFLQMAKNPTLLLVAWGVAIGTAFSNNAALMIIKERSATLTMIVDNLRALVVWIMSLAFQWEIFNFWQPIGFSVVIFGFLMYTTDYVHLLCVKICPLYERFVNKEDQDENEKTPSHCKEKPNCEGKVVFDGESSQRSSKGNLDV